MGRDHSIECEVCGCERGGLNDVLCDCFIDEDLDRMMAGERLDRLSANLRTAGALCASYEIALDPCDRIYYEQAISGIDDWQEHWHPGCQRPAPGQASGGGEETP
jgi:hypothetical protein